MQPDWPPGRRVKEGPAAEPGPSDTNGDAGSSTRDSVASAAGAAGELAAWAAAVVHLHGLGLPAAVPAFPAAWLARRGVRPDWTAAA